VAGSSLLPPRKVEKPRAAPLAFSLVTKASYWPRLVSKAPAVVGKSVEPVPPVT
jgi:hypothetical protein